jgi:gamma-glutamyltranspeptidase/glutathione hydrolase
MLKFYDRIKRPILGLAISAGILTSIASQNSNAQHTPTGTAKNSAIQYDTSAEIITPIHSKNGVVASEHVLASEVGLDILKRGGNAVDAGVAVGFALAVVLPNAGNIGGGGFMMIHDAKSGKQIALDFRELAPALAHADMYLDAHGNIIPRKSTSTHFAVGVPGTVAGLSMALKRYGTMKLADLIGPSIKLAEDGFTVTEPLAEMLRASQNQLGKWPASRAIFFKGNRPLQAGEHLVQKDLAKSLRLIAQQGEKAFYEGEIAQKIAAEMKTHGAPLSLEDFKNYRAIERTPVRGNYRGYDIVSMPPPSSGGVHIIQMLNMLQHYPIKDYGSNSAQTIHLMSEVMKLAYADRSEYLGDPDFVKIPLRGLTSLDYAKSLIKKINLEKSTPSIEIKPNQPQHFESDQTTHYTVADKEGNVVATTYTLNLLFGSGIVATGTGILLNNEMDDFSVKAGVPNAFGLIGGSANAVAAKKRPLSSMSPTLVLKDGKMFLTTGSPGGSRIITTTLQIIMNVIDHNMNVAEATITPRMHHQWEPDQLRLEKGFNVDTLNLLKNKGHIFRTGANMGRTQTIMMKAGSYEAYSDPRNPDGRALGY